MGLRILHSADWHLDSPFARLSPEQRHRLRREQRKLPERVGDLIRRENCDLVLLSGDIFDGEASRDTVDILRTALEGWGVPVFISPGNHDFITPDSPWLRESWPENVHIFTGGITSIPLPELDCRIWGAGYQSMDCPPLLENFRAVGEERYHLCVLHGDPTAQQSPYCPVTAAQVRPSGLSYLALGHIHKAGAFRAGDTLCGWPGTLMGRGYDETGEKGVYLVDLEDRAQCRFVPLDTPRFYDLEVDTDIQTPDDLLPAGESCDFFRVTLTGSGGESLERLQERYPHLPNLEWNDRRTEKADPWARAGEDTLEGVYFRLLRERMAQAGDGEVQLLRRAAELSLKILEGREVAL